MLDKIWMFFKFRHALVLMCRLFWITWIAALLSQKIVICVCLGITVSTVSIAMSSALVEDGNLLVQALNSMLWLSVFIIHPMPILLFSNEPSVYACI